MRGEHSFRIRLRSSQIGKLSAILYTFLIRKRSLFKLADRFKLNVLTLVYSGGAYLKFIISIEQFDELQYLFANFGVDSPSQTARLPRLPPVDVYFARSTFKG